MRPFCRSWCVSIQPWFLDDDSWARVKLLLPPWLERSPGRRPVDDRLCLQGGLYVRYNDIARQLPPPLSWGLRLRPYVLAAPQESSIMISLRALRRFLIHSGRDEQQQHGGVASGSFRAGCARA